MAANGEPVCLSIAFNWHDSSCALSIGQRVICGLELERLFRRKKICASLSQMELAAHYILKRSGLDIDQVDHLVVNATNNPFEAKRYKQDVARAKYTFLGKKLPTLVVRHHYAHAGFYYLSPYNHALVSSCDGGGDLGERVAYFLGDGVTLKRLDGDTSAHTSALPYAQFSAFLYGSQNTEGKMMALAGLGQADEALASTVSALFPELRDMTVQEGKALLAATFPGLQDSAKDGSTAGADLACAVQEEFVRRRIADVASVYRPDQHDGLVIVGGSALNLSCNTEFFQSLTEDIYIPPCCDDTGIAIGQLAVAIAQITGQRPLCELPYIGIDEPPRERKLYLANMPAPCDIVTNPKKAAKRIHQGEICIAHIGYSEAGPRALGHRSFLVAPTEEMRDIISIDVKKREQYRPVAPILLEEDLDLYFEGGPETSPFMLHSYSAKSLARERAPGAVHSDGTARAQTVDDRNKELYQLLKAYRKVAGCSILINTSLNLTGDPLANGLHDTFAIARSMRRPAFIYTA